MIKFYCAFCKKKIGVPESFAGKQVKCPKCQLAGRVPPVSTPAPTQSETITLDDVTDDLFPTVKPKDPLSLGEPLPPDSPDPLQLSPDRESRSVCSKCQFSINPQDKTCVSCGAEIADPKAEENPDETPQKTKWIKSIATGSGFGKDLLGLMFPIRSGADAIAFTFLLIIYTLATTNIPILSSMCIWMITRILLYGYFLIYLFNVLLETANGGNHLPEFELPDSYWDMIRTFLQGIVSIMYAGLPLVAGFFIAVSLIGFDKVDSYLIDDSMPDDSLVIQDEDFYDSFPAFENQDVWLIEPNTINPEGGSSEDPNNVMIDSYGQDAMSWGEFTLVTSFLVLFFLGLFFWPMIVLNIVLGDSFVVNPIKVMMNIIRTFKAYFICCVALFIAAGFTYLSNFSATITGLISGNTLYMIFALVASVIGGLCVDIYAMRALGLLYRYYEEKLDW